MISSRRSVVVLTSLLVFLVAIMSTVRGCGQMPFGQARAVNFAVGGFTLPSAMAFAAATSVQSQVPQISRSPEAAMALVRNLVMQAVNDVLEENGRSQGLPGFVVSAILGQLTIQVNYVPIGCNMAFLAPTAPQPQPQNPMAGQNFCFIINDRVTALCTMMNCALSPMAMDVNPIPDQHMRISGSVTTTNFIMANWSSQMWQSVLNRALQSIRRGPFGTHFAAAFVTVM